MNKTMKCSACQSIKIEFDQSRGTSYCTDCGSVVEESNIVSELTFQEDGAGNPSVVGQFLSADGIKSYASSRAPGASTFGKDTRAITLANSHRKIQALAATLKLNQHCVDAAQRLFMLALQHNFVRGRKTEVVVAACLYVICRREKTPHMLLDFADALQVNMFVVGNCFLKLARKLNLDLPIVDPSLYIHRFVGVLEFGDKKHAVAMSALRILARMKRDWMEVGRRPAGLCGASIFIASRVHEFRRSQREIAKAVHVCNATVRKRLTEFRETPAAKLTVFQFESGNAGQLEPYEAPSYRKARAVETEANLATRAQISSREGLPKESEVAEEIERVMESDAFKEVVACEIVLEKVEAESSMPKESPSVSEPVEELDIDDEDINKYICQDAAEIQQREKVWDDANAEYYARMLERRTQAGPARRRNKRKRDAVVDGGTVESAIAAVQKKASSKINYSALKGLFGADLVAPETEEQDELAEPQSARQKLGYEDEVEEEREIEMEPV